MNIINNVFVLLPFVSRLQISGASFKCARLVVNGDHEMMMMLVMVVVGLGLG